MTKGSPKLPFSFLPVFTVDRAIQVTPRAETTSVVLHAVRHLIKLMHLASWQGANHSDTQWYREDLQRHHGGKGEVLCAE